MRKNNIINDLNEIRSTMDSKKVKKLNLDKLERIIIRLDEFSNDCQQCNHDLLEIHEHIEILKNDRIQSFNIKEYEKNIRNIITHLTKEHQLIPKDYYAGTYMSFGMTIGIIFGLIFFDNIALGMSIGISIGLALGAGKDSEAKKDGRVI